MPYSSKTEESLKKLLDDHSNKILITNMNQVNNRAHIIFIAGIIVGMILSSTGLLGFIAGVVTGGVITTNYSVMSTNINDILEKKEMSMIWGYYDHYIKKPYLTTNKNE